MKKQGEKENIKEKKKIMYEKLETKLETKR